MIGQNFNQAFAQIACFANVSIDDTVDWRVKNRNSKKCLDIENFLTDDGANVIQWTNIKPELIIRKQFSC